MGSPTPSSPNGPIGKEIYTNRIVTIYHYFTWYLVDECVAKQVNEYKVKLQKADQEIATLQATVCSKKFKYKQQQNISANFFKILLLGG